MAEIKKSFVIHLDSLDVLDDLTAEQTQQLVFAWRDYHLGKKPVLTGLMNAVFKSFKNQFERDLEKYNNVIERNKNNGKNGGRPKTQANPKNPVGYLETQANPSKPKKPDNVSDSDSDSVNVNENKDIPPTAFSFYKSLISAGADSKLANEWLVVRKKKNLSNTETAFKGFIREMEKGGLSINETLRVCVEKSWGGLTASWLQNIKLDVRVTDSETLDQKAYREHVEQALKMRS